MMRKTTHTVPDVLIDKAQQEFAFNGFKTPINKPTGNFFYDPWEIKEEFKGTVWDDILKTLPYTVGEARLINLKYGVCYQSHADIDDRYHLNIQGDMSYLVNLDNDTMHRITNDGYWYELDAGPRHSAMNVGYVERIQLVVRKLLSRNTVDNPIKITITSTSDNVDENRFRFDNTVSSLLNRYNKEGIISDFFPTLDIVTLTINNEYVEELTKALPSNFMIRNNND